MAAESYTISINLGDKTLKGQGKSMYEALSSIEPPVKIVHKVIVNLAHGARKYELIFQPLKAKRLFYPNAQRILAKNFEYLLK